MSKYAALFRMRFINGLQYRAAALAGVATQFAWGSMEILAFSAFYRSNPAAFPMEFRQTVTYIWLQQSLMALFFTWFWDGEITSSIESGSIAYELVRPMDLYARWFSQSAAGRVARAALRCSPILLVAAFLPAPYGLMLPPDLQSFALFLMSLILAFGVVVAFTMVLYMSMFYTISSVGTRYIAAVLADFLAGAYVPLPFFPDPVRRVVELLPFASMQNMPLRIYSGNIAGMDALKGMALQLFWLVVLVSIGKIGMTRAVRRVVVQGG